MNILSLDVGGTAIKTAFFKDGALVKNEELASDGSLGGPSLIQNIINAIESYDCYDVIGISSTGQVDSSSGTILYANDNIPNYIGTPLGNIIKNKYNKPVYVENDVNAAAIGEAFYGAGRDYKDFLCLTYGTGIGGGIMFENHLFKGHKGVAGEVGHIILHPDGRRCMCGNYGCYEQYASTTALVRKAKEYDKRLTNGYLIFKEIENRNDEVKAIVDAWINEVIFGLTTLIHIFNPPLIILGGGIMNQPYILNSINSKIKDRLMHVFQDVQITSAQLGNLAGVYGMRAIAEKLYQ